MLLPENASTWLDDMEPKAIKVQFCTRNAMIETVCHQADFLNSALSPDFEKSNMNRYSGSLHSYHYHMSAKV